MQRKEPLHGSQSRSISPPVLTFIILTAYSISFFLPVIPSDDGQKVAGMIGIEAAIYAVRAGMEYGLVILLLIVIANLVFTIGLWCLFFRRWFAASVLGFLGFALAVLMGFGAGRPFLNLTDQGLGMGYYFWAAPMMALSIAGVIQRR